MNPQQTWRKSSYSSSENACIELTVHPTRIGIRDTKNRSAGELWLPQSPYQTFLRAVKFGRLNA